MNCLSTNEMLEKLSKSKFRSSFELKDKDIEYINKRGIETIKNHAYDFIEMRLAHNEIKNDGKQTPFKGHPVFIAQHATATCCRKCLYKWYHIDTNRNLTKEEIEYIISIIITWIEKAMKKNS